jgi:hypothetical protein
MTGKPSIAERHPKPTNILQIFRRCISKSTIQKKRILLDFVKIDLCSVKNMVNITKRENTDWEESLVIYEDMIL